MADEQKTTGPMCPLDRGGPREECAAWPACQCEQKGTAIIVPPDRADVLWEALAALAAPVPSMRGYGPRDRADRLRAELERRIAAAKDALHG